MVEIVAGPAGPNQYRVAVHKNLLINSCKEAAQFVHPPHVLAQADIQIKDI